MSKITIGEATREQRQQYTSARTPAAQMMPQQLQQERTMYGSYQTTPTGLYGLKCKLCGQAHTWMQCLVRGACRIMQAVCGVVCTVVQRSPMLSSFWLTFRVTALFPVLLFGAFTVGMFAMFALALSPVLMVALGVTCVISLGSVNFVTAGRAIYAVTRRLLGVAVSIVPTEAVGHTMQQAGLSLAEVGQQTAAAGSSPTTTIGVQPTI